MDKRAFDFSEPSWAEMLYPGVLGDPAVAEDLLELLRSPQGHAPNQVRAWLTDVLEAFDLKATSWAKTAGLAPSTVNRFLSVQDKTTNLSASTIDRLSAALYHLMNKDVVYIQKRQAEKVTPFFSLNSTTITNVFMKASISARTTIVSAPGQDDPSAKPEAHRLVNSNVISVPIPAKYGHAQMIGVEVVDDTFLPVYQPCTVLICAPVYRLDGLPRTGCKFVVHERLSEKKFRALLRELVVDPDGGGWFMPVGRDRYNNVPGIYLENLPESSPVRATFLIVASYQYDGALLQKAPISA